MGRLNLGKTPSGEEVLGQQWDYRAVVALHQRKRECKETTPNPWRRSTDRQSLAQVRATILALSTKQLPKPHHYQAGQLIRGATPRSRIGERRLRALQQRQYARISRDTAHPIRTTSSLAYDLKVTCALCFCCAAWCRVESHGTGHGAHPHTKSSSPGAHFGCNRARVQFNTGRAGEHS
jgi:hypothetical protein